MANDRNGLENWLNAKPEPRTPKERPEWSEDGKVTLPEGGEIGAQESVEPALESKVAQLAREFDQSEGGNNPAQRYIEIADALDENERREFADLLSKYGWDIGTRDTEQKEEEVDRAWAQHREAEPKDPEQRTEEQLIAGLEGLNSPEASEAPAAAQVTEPPAEARALGAERTAGEVLRNVRNIGKFRVKPVRVGPDGEAYMIQDGREFRVNDGMSWGFQTKSGARRRMRWDAKVREFVDYQPTEREGAEAEAPAPAAESEPPAEVERAEPRAPEIREERIEPPKRPERRERADRIERLARPEREPDGEFEDLDYWIEADGSAVIEDRRNSRKVYRVQRGGLHWIAPGREREDKKANRADAEGLYWSGTEWKRMKRSEWGSEGVRAHEGVSEKTPEKSPDKTAEKAKLKESVREPAETSKTGTFDRDRSRNRSIAETFIRNIQRDVVETLVSPEIGSSPAPSVALEEQGRIEVALRSLAETNTGNFNKARMELSSISSYTHKAHKEVEQLASGIAQQWGISHQTVAQALHEPDPYRREDLVRAAVESRFGFFKKALNFVSFRYYGLSQARRIDQSISRLVPKRKEVESELKRRKTALYSVLGIT